MSRKLIAPKATRFPAKIFTFNREPAGASAKNAIAQARSRLYDENRDKGSKTTGFNIKLQGGDTVATYKRDIQLEEIRKCKRGHEMTPENTYIRTTDGHHTCRECTRIESRERYRIMARRKAARESLI